MNNVELIVPARASLGEGPCWDWRTNVLYWVDINKGTGEKTGLVVALRNGIYVLNRETGEKTLLADPESYLPGNRFNDGKVDGHGRFWVGSMDIAEAGGLFRVRVTTPGLRTNLFAGGK